MKKIQLPIRNVPRFFVLLADFITIVSSFAFSYFIEKQLDFTDISRKDFIVYTLTYSFAGLVVFYAMKIHTGVVRYTTIADMSRIFGAIVGASGLYVLLDQFVVYRLLHLHSLSVVRILIINFFVSFTALILLRIAVRGVYYYLKQNHT
ncbi:MAG: hypothetical protein ABI415_02315 [Flavitalea sp.]